MSRHELRGLRPPAAALALAAAFGLLYAAPTPGRGQDTPPGLTGAVLSFVDAGAGRVEVVRHWPGRPADVDVYPFIPYFWNGCPGPGAIMVLVTGAPQGWPNAPGTSITQRTREIGSRVAQSISMSLPEDPREFSEIRNLISGVRTPGDPMFEAAKALVPQVADLATYERRGYAVFAFIMWQGWRCGVMLRAVPEGYAIPFVR